MENTILDYEAIQKDLQKSLFEKAETDMDIRRGELQVKRFNAMANLEKTKLEFMKTQLAQRRLELDARRLELDEISKKFEISEALSRKPDKILRSMGKIAVGLFPEQDKQIVDIMKAAKKVSDIGGKE